MLQFLLELHDFMDKAGVVEDFKHELFPIITVLLENVIWASHTLVESSSVEQISFKVAHVASDVMGQFTELSALQFLWFLVSGSTML